MGIIKNISRKRTEKLARKGYACLKEKDYEGALKIAKQLEKRYYTASFEIAALAHMGLDNPEEAVKTLERGVDLAPACWANWELLGNFRSDLGRYDEAGTAYKNALECMECWESSIRLNQAILAERLEQYGDVLKILDCVDDPELRLEVAATRIGVLIKMERLEEAARLALTTLDDQWDVESGGEPMARVAAHLARIRLLQGENREQVRKFVIKSLDYHHNSPFLLAVIRDINARFSSTAKHYQLLINAKIHAACSLYGEAKGFYVNYYVLADDADEALEFIREIESDEEVERLGIEDLETLENLPYGPKGIHWRDIRLYYENA